MTKKNKNDTYYFDDFAVTSSFDQERERTININSPDIIIMDIDMPNSSGLSIIKTLKQNNPEVRIIIFSHQPEELYALSAIRFGASGYINKSKSLKKIKINFRKRKNIILFLKTIALGVKGSDSPNKTASYGVTLVTYQTEMIFLTLKIATWTVEQHPSETVTKLE